jgi:hypothetical protein
MPIKLTASRPEASPETPAMGDRWPDFLIIGAAKTGTTTLHHYLNRHPRLFMSAVKEPSFFSFQEGQPPLSGWRRMREWYRQGLEAQGQPPDPSTAPGAEQAPGWTWESATPWYCALFAGAAENQLCGESSTNYTRWPQMPGVPARIAQKIPNAKLIYMMRHPVDRAYSHFVHRYAKELYPLRPFTIDFETFIQQESMCLDSSDYLRQIEQFLPFFPRASFLFLIYEDFKHDPAPVLRRLLEFLGVEVLDLLGDEPLVRNETKDFGEAMALKKLSDPFRRNPLVNRVRRFIPRAWRDTLRSTLIKSPLARRLKQQLTAPPMRPETRHALLERFREPNRRLGEFLGLDLSRWDH